jgi:tetratricopeptide (TPR) repeat protein
MAEADYSPMQTALDLFNRHRFEEARTLCHQMLLRDAELFGALYIAAMAEAAVGRLPESARLFERAIGIKPRDEAALQNYAAVLSDLGRFEDAEGILQQAISISERNPQLYCLLGHTLRKRSQSRRAADCYCKALSLEPTFLDALLHLADTLIELGDLDPAYQAADHAVTLAPDSPIARGVLGLASLRCGRNTDAIVHLERAVALAPGFTEARANLGIAYATADELPRARAALEKTIELEPAMASAHHDLGVVLMRLGEPERAISILQRAVELDPNDSDARLLRGHARLLIGDFQQGWHDCEARLSGAAPSVKIRAPTGLARWDGSNLAGRTLVVVAEQGFGDTIQFVRFARKLNQRGIFPVLQCHARLVRLLSSCGYFSAVVPFEKQFDAAAHCWFPLLSLPDLLGAVAGEFSAPIPYLKADPQMMRTWRERIAALPGLKIGIAWQGNPRHEKGYLRQRSTPLQAFEALAARTHVSLISLQKNDGLEQIDKVGFAGRLTRFDAQLDCGDDAFADTAALMMSLDLIISTDTAVPHIAGALGRPVWLALARVPDWRWMLERSDTPWYPTMRLFRQTVPQAWSVVFEEIAACIDDFIAP